MLLNNAYCNHEFLVKDYPKKYSFLRNYGIIVNQSIYFINRSIFSDYYIIQVDNKLLAIPFHISKEIELYD